MTGPKRPEWRLPGLPADGPHREWAAKLRLFGQFIGSWAIHPHRPGRTAPPAEARIGEVHAAWVLDGRAVQDVWGPVDPESGRFVPAGTTLRFYDHKREIWRSTWISPLQREVRRFEGRRIGDEIVLAEVKGRYEPENWVFSEIEEDSFRWRAERRSHHGGDPRLVEEMFLHRMEPR